MTLIKIILFILFSIESWGKVTPDSLSQEAFKNITQVPEFSYIKKAADEIGVKVYLFGGSAAAYAHYVRWYIELQAGSDKHQPERFDFDYTNIYRGNQDLDLVVDGTEEQARLFQEFLQNKYAHVVGDKNDWEVRLLQGQIGDKLPLLEDPDFKNQHTDTNSTGMLDVTAKKGEPVFRDLLDWENPDSTFLKDVASAKITYLFNQNHEETTRFKQGKNPPIFSAVRYLAKLTQYEVTGTKKDLNIIRKIIKKTDFSNLSRYIQIKLGEFAKKTLLNSPNSEYAWDLMEELGLRTQLIAMDENQIDVQDSLSWWLNKEPLRTKELGNKGKTAKEIFGKDQIVVSHETGSFVAYENITRSSRGEANVFISRRGIVGEAAYHGDGFYVKEGKKGARNSGLTIRFYLHPEAREGEDFDKVNDFLIIKNKKALTLIQENINMSLVDFLKLVFKNNIGKDDKGLKEKFFRKFNRLDNSSKEYQEAVKFLKSKFFISDHPDFPPMDLSDVDFTKFESLMELATEGWENYKNTVKNFIQVQEDDFWRSNPQLIEELVKVGDYDHVLISDVIFNLQIGDKNDWFLEMIRRGNEDQLLIYVLQQSWWKPESRILEAIIRNGSVSAGLIQMISGEFWVEHDDLLEEIIDLVPEVDVLNIAIARGVFGQAHWNKRPDLFKKIIEREGTQYRVAKDVLSLSHWKNHPELVGTLIEQNGGVVLAIEHVLSQGFWENPGRWIEAILEESDRYDELLAQHVLSKPHGVNKKWYQMIFERSPAAIKSLIQFSLGAQGWEKHPEIIEELIKDEKNDDLLIQYVFSQSHWSELPQWSKWVQTIMERNYNHDIANYVLSQKSALKFPEFVERLIEDAPKDVAIFILSQEHWSSRPDLLEKLILSKKFQADHYGYEDIASFVFSQPYWSDQAALFAQYIKKSVMLGPVIMKVLPMEHWSDSPELVEEALAKNTLKEDVVKQILSQDHWFLKHPYLIEMFIDKYLEEKPEGKLERALVNHVFADSKFEANIDLIFEYIKRRNYSSQSVERVLAFPYVAESKEIADYLNGKKISFQNLKARMEEISFREWRTEKRARQVKGFTCQSVLN